MKNPVKFYQFDCVALYNVDDFHLVTMVSNVLNGLNSLSNFTRSPHKEDSY